MYRWQLFDKLYTAASDNVSPLSRMVNGKMVHSFEKRREGMLAIGQRKKDRSAELKSARPSPWVLYCPSVAHYNGRSQSRSTLSMAGWSNAGR